MKTRILIFATIASAPSAPAATLLFDLGHTDQQSAGNWNNILRTTTVLNSTIDSTGLASTIGLRITETFYDVGEPSSFGSENPSGAAGSYPVTATDDYLFGHTTDFGGSVPNPDGQFRLINLEPGVPYYLTFFASRTGVNDNREALYTATGSNSGSASLNSSNNESEVARIIGILPDANNEILINSEAGPNNDNDNGFFYFGILEVNTRPVPEPSVPMSLLSAMGFLLARRRTRRGSQFNQ